MVAAPEDHSDCRVHDGLTLCAYHDYADITDVWSDELTAPFAAVPPRAAPMVSPCCGENRVWSGSTPPSVSGSMRRPHGIVGGGCRTWNGVAVVGTDTNLLNRLALGLWSVGLPLVASDGEPCYVGGEARGVVAPLGGCPRKATRHRANLRERLVEWHQ